jgi:hypothetical protein
MNRNASWSVVALAVLCALGCTSAFAADTSYADDRAHIENLIARYFFALDTQDPDAFVANFAKDGEIVLTGAKIAKPVVFRGPEQLRQFVEVLRQRTKMPPHGARMMFSPNIHFMSNLALEVNGDTAVGRAYWFTVRRGENHDLITEANPNPSKFASIGLYDEAYVRVNGAWLFKRITVSEMMPQVRPRAAAASRSAADK